MARKLSVLMLSLVMVFLLLVENHGIKGNISGNEGQNRESASLFKGKREKIKKNKPIFLSLSLEISRPLSSSLRLACRVSSHRRCPPAMPTGVLSLHVTVSRKLQRLLFTAPELHHCTATSIEAPTPQPHSPAGNQPMYGVTQGSLHPQECAPRCSARCSKTQYKKPCLFFCQKCCAKCLCVPPGTYGNKQFCPCYDDWKTKRGGPKCP